MLSISREPGCDTIGHFVGRRLGCARSETVQNLVLGHILSISILIKDAVPACAGVEFADCAFILLGAKGFCDGGCRGRILGWMRRWDGDNYLGIVCFHHYSWGGREVSLHGIPLSDFVCRLFHHLVHEIGV